jgi:hypothetical protein
MALVDHHVAHAASAYYASGFDEATVLTLDRRGDFRCGARWLGSGNQLTLPAWLVRRARVANARMSPSDAQPPMPPAPEVRRGYVGRRTKQIRYLPKLVQ